LIADLRHPSRLLRSIGGTEWYTRILFRRTARHKHPDDVAYGGACGRTDAPNRIDGQGTFSALRDGGYGDVHGVSAASPSSRLGPRPHTFTTFHPQPGGPAKGRRFAYGPRPGGTPLIRGTQTSAGETSEVMKRNRVPSRGVGVKGAGKTPVFFVGRGPGGHSGGGWGPPASGGPFRQKGRGQGGRGGGWGGATEGGNRRTNETTRTGEQGEVGGARRGGAGPGTGGERGGEPQKSLGGGKGCMHGGKSHQGKGGGAAGGREHGGNRVAGGQGRPRWWLVGSPSTSAGSVLSRWDGGGVS